MSNPSPILSYATPNPRPPIYLAVILYLWGIFDLLLCILLVVVANEFRQYIGSAKVKEAFMVMCIALGLALCLLILSVATFYFAQRIHKGTTTALSSATKFTGIAAITWYAVWTVIALVAPIGVVLAILLPIPIAATVTWILFRHAAKRIPTWE